MLFKKIFRKREYNRINLENLNNHPCRDKYFARTKPWDWLDDKHIFVSSILNDQPTMITMEYWAQEIFLHADGQLAVADFFSIAEKQYLDNRMDVPEHLDLVLLDDFDRLQHKLGIIILEDEKIVVPSELRIPMSKQADLN